MCKYRYGEGLCASPLLEGKKCTGESSCSVFLNSVESDETSCKEGSWQGVYCPKYKKFFCAGKGNCDTAESYMRSFALVRKVEEGKA